MKNGRNKSVNVEDIVKIDNIFHIAPIDIVNINGGEPTLAKDFIEIINKCLEFSKHIVVYSNGRNLSKLPDEIIGRVERFIVPIYGPRDFHNQYVSSGSAYQETVESLSRIIEIDPSKIEIKLLLDPKTNNIESFFDSCEWQSLSTNMRYSVTRLLESYEDKTPCSPMLVGRAERIIRTLLESGKIVKYYDLPFCYFTKEFQTYVLSIYSHENIDFDVNVVHGKNGGKFSIFNYNQRTLDWEKCSTCENWPLCAQIMHNYFCPTISNGVCKILTE